MSTTQHVRRSAAAALILAAILVFATTSALAAPARQSTTGPYPWPVEPFDAPHPIRGSFGDPRTIFFGPPTTSTLRAGNGNFTFHSGVDISAPDGTPVYPVESGTVRSVSDVWLVVDGGIGRSFEYWHIAPAVSVGQHVTAETTVLGHILRGCGHVHLTELDNGVKVNPLALGHLTPYMDTTVPQVSSVRFRTSVVGDDLMPELVRGTVELLASVSDMPTMQVPGAWRDIPRLPRQIF
jgi:murein DD-endopeptidase MepM/ murein hydrolase activator NlpD